MHGSHPLRAVLAVVLVASLVPFGAGCAGGSSVERGIDHAHQSIAASFDGSVVEERLYELDVDGIVDVDLESFAGDVVIRGGRETKGKAILTATVLAGHGRDRQAEAEASLDEVAVKAEIRRGGDVPVLAVRCTTEHDEPWLLRANLDIELPELRRVRVKTRGGKVYVFENRGACHVHTADGDVRMFTPWAISEDVTLVTRGGEIVFRAFTGTCGIFDVECVNGDVKARVEAGDWRILDRRNDHDTLHATLGTCTNRITIRNVDAKVRVSVVKDPMDYGSIFASP
jgi:hypothetical protein